MARKSSADMEKTKQVLLEEGVALLQERGYHATGIQEIATSANIPKGSFYNYFASKEEFAAAVIRHYAQTSLCSWQESLNQAAAQYEPGEVLYQTFLAATEKYRCSEQKKGCLLGTLAAEISEASEECRQALQASIANFIKVLAEHLARGQAGGAVRREIEPQLLATIVWDVWQGSLLRMKVEKSVAPVQADLDVLFHQLLRP